MRRLAPIFALWTAAAGAEVIDRIAVTLGNQVITASDLDREIRVSALLNGTQPDFSPAVKRTTADRMVQQRLVRRELELSRFATPDPADVEGVLKTFRDENYPDDARWRTTLQQARVTESEIREHILWQLTLLRFVEMRFGPGVQVTEEDVVEYFQKSVVPIARSASAGETPSLEDYRQRIVEILTQERVDRDLDAWITEARKRVGVRYRKEVFGQ